MRNFTPCPMPIDYDVTHCVVFTCVGGRMVLVIDGSSLSRGLAIKHIVLYHTLWELVLILCGVALGLFTCIMFVQCLDSASPLPISHRVHCTSFGLHYQQ